MATSGTYDFGMKVGVFLDNALYLAGVTAEGETSNPEQYKKALESLNLQQGQLEVNGLPLWKRDFYDFAAVASSYVTNNSVQYRCVKGNTAVAADEPGVGALWEQSWVADSNTSASPSAWSLSTVYVTSIEFTVPARFYDILIVTCLQNSSNEIGLQIQAFEDYSRNTNSKRTSLEASVPISVAFDNKLTNTGHIYPQPNLNFDSSFRIYGVLKPEDATTNSDDIDIPSRYLNVLRYTVALDLAFMYQKDAETITLLKRQAAYYVSEYHRSNVESVTDNIVTGVY